MLYLQPILDSLKVLETEIETTRLKVDKEIKQIRIASFEELLKMQNNKAELRYLFLSKLKTLSPKTVYLVKEEPELYYALSYDRQRHLVKEKFWYAPDSCRTCYVSTNSFCLFDGLKEVTKVEFIKLLQEKNITY